MMRTDIEFEAEGVTLRGWFFRPDDAADALPTVVMAHGFSAVKEMYLDAYAERFTEAGLAALVFDNRNFGSSHGEPRQEIDPWAPAWRNEVTLRSVEMLTEYEPGSYIERVPPTPLLRLVGAGDHLTVADEALAAFNRAMEPKHLVLLAGGHFDAYVDDFQVAAGEAADWFARHLAASPAR